MREILFMLKNAPITSLIVGVCSIVFVIAFVLQQDNGKLETAKRLGAVVPASHQYWRLVTANFIHVDLLHYLFNMFFLIDLGSQIEYRSRGFNYLILMIVSGLFSTGLTYVYDTLRHKEHMTLGASGFGFGLLGVLAGFMVFGKTLIFHDTRALISMIVLNLVYTFTRPHISKTGHIGGFVAGLMVSLLW